MTQKSRIILGIDPGTRVTGYGTLQCCRHQCQAVDYGCIKPRPTMHLHDRYHVIFNSINELLDKFAPHAVAVETQYVHRNPQSALKLGMACGVIIIAVRNRNIPIFEYAPSKAKLAVVGSGRASKYQVQKTLQMLLNLSEYPQPEDAADALALAYCHYNAAWSIQDC